MADNRNRIISGRIDWWSILIYIALILMGWISIYAAVYDESHASIFDVSRRYGMQLIWIGVSVSLALVIMLLDDKYYHIWAYLLYAVMILVLTGVLFLGKEVNGARAWIEFGSVKIQPAEFAKYTTSLALARYMSSYHFDIAKWRHILVMGAIIAVPALIIILQNDTGSALVYAAFLFMLYREGFNRWVYVVLIAVVTLFILSFVVDPLVLLLCIFFFTVLCEGVVNGHWKRKAAYIAMVGLISVLLYYACRYAFDYELSVFSAVLISIGVSLIPVSVYAYKIHRPNVFFFILFFAGSLSFTASVDYAFDNFLQVHQQKRILDLLGLESDVRGWGYNVNQSKIAVGSGGFAGKGFLEGTQTKYDFVPEQSTDFIFCTVGEEWGFLGSSLVVILFAMLIIRLIRMGERQKEPFGRIYCYCAASIFLFHVAVNIAMTIGLGPVIGIPLPFFSYGGSSLMAFTILLFTAIKLDSAKG